MCGIFGHTFRQDIRLDLSRTALKVLDHRGPDSWADWHDKNVYSGHTRLAILDLSDNGKQPMYDLDRSVVITVNGEIYNFRVLRSFLSKKYSFTSESDSEVILHGYREWGIEGLLNRLEGMYAFSVYDVINKVVYLARDRVGIKPLYYSSCRGEVAWASELKAIEIYSKNELNIDLTAYYDFLTYRYVPSPKTIYKEVNKLPAGHFVKIDLNTLKITVRQYWDVEVGGVGLSLNEASVRLQEIVDEAVDKQMVSDAPLGMFLSGGLDSSIVANSVSKCRSGIKSYCIDFDDSEYDESVYAEIMAKKCLTDHSNKTVSSDSAIAVMDKLKTLYDEPFADSSAIPTYLLSKFAANDCKVLLSGDGGDELFAGYKSYSSFMDKSKLIKLNNPSIVNALEKLRSSNQNNFFSRVIRHYQRRNIYIGIELFASIMGGLTKAEKDKYKSLWGIENDYDDYWYYRKYYREDLDCVTRLQYLDFKTLLPDCILTKVDRASMSASIEVRVPLLSTKLIEFSFSLPAEITYLNNELKGFAKYSYANTLPREIISRGKRGFSIPIHKWRSKLIEGSYTWQEHILISMFNQEKSLGL